MDVVYEESQTKEVAEEILQRLGAAEGGARVLALSGELGAGKTTLVQHIAKLLGVTLPITSPTFVVMKQYDLFEGGFVHLYHIDAYRIESESELEPLHFGTILKEKQALIIIEWAERIKTILPGDTIWITITHNGTKRRLTLHANS